MLGWKKGLSLWRSYFNKKNMTTTVGRNITSGVLTFEEIKAVAGEGWAIIKNPVRERGVLISGELYFHSHDYEEALDAMSTSGAKHVAIKFCGKRDPNVVYIF